MRTAERIIQLLLNLLLLAGLVFLYVDRERLRQELRQGRPQVSERILETVREVPVAQPVRTEVRVADRVVPVEVTRYVDRVVDRPVERVVTVTEPAPCRTEEECRRIFAASPQTVSVEARLRAGTPVPVEVDGEVREVRLARDVPLRVDLVQAEGGVFVAVQRPDNPVAVDRVVTQTQVPLARARARDGKWAITVGVSDAVGVGLSYELVRVGDVTLDGALFSTLRSGNVSIHAGVGLGYSVNESLKTGLAYTQDQRLWLYVGFRL